MLFVVRWSNKTFIQIKTTGGGEKKERFFIQNPKHKIFTSAEFFFKLEFHHNLFFVYIFVL